MFNDATNRSDCMTSNAWMTHWKWCRKKRLYTVLRYYAITCLGKWKDPRNTSGRRVGFGWRCEPGISRTWSMSATKRRRRSDPKNFKKWSNQNILIISWPWWMRRHNTQLSLIYINIYIYIYIYIYIRETRSWPGKGDGQNSLFLQPIHPDLLLSPFLSPELYSLSFSVEPSFLQPLSSSFFSSLKTIPHSVLPLHPFFGIHFPLNSFVGSSTISRPYCSSEAQYRIKRQELLTKKCVCLRMCVRLCARGTGDRGQTVGY